MHNFDFLTDSWAKELGGLIGSKVLYASHLARETYSDTTFVVATVDGTTLEAIPGGGYVLDSGTKPVLWTEKDAAQAAKIWNRSEVGAKYPVCSLPWRKHFQSQVARLEEKIKGCTRQAEPLEPPRAEGL